MAPYENSLKQNYNIEIKFKSKIMCQKFVTGATFL